MRTTKPISTISFNSVGYLKLKLQELTKAGRISFWAFMLHKPEDDEAGNKEHCHLYIEPSKMMQTDDLKNELREFDPAKPDKPKGCLGFRISKFDHWYLYGLHDKRYLAMKGEARRFHYSHDEFVSSDDDELLFLARSIDMMSLSPYADMLDAQNQGLSWAEYFSRGTVPIPQITAFQNAWHLLLSTKTQRGVYDGHPMDIDEDTGEIVNADDKIEIGGTPPAFYQVHPQGDFTPLDPEEELPF